MQPKTGLREEHVPMSFNVLRSLRAASCGGVGSARQSPSHSPLSAHATPPSCVGIRQIGVGKIPAGPQSPPAASQAGLVSGMAGRELQSLCGLGCRGLPTGCHTSSTQVQYPWAWVLDDGIIISADAPASATIRTRNAVKPVCRSELSLDGHCRDMSSSACSKHL